MKRINLIIIAAIVVIVGLIFYLKSNETKTTLDIADDHFQVKDTAQITQIFIATKSGNTNTLKKKQGGWQLNDNYFVNKVNMDLIMEVLMKMRVKSPVGVQSRDGVIKNLSANHYKIELYNANGLFRTYFMGASTQDGLGNYIYEEGMDIPYIVHIPGWNGNFGPRLDINEMAWRRTQIFPVTPPAIRSYSVQYFDQPEWSYELKVDSNKQIGLYSLSNPTTSVPEFDMSLARQELYNINKVHFTEYIADSLPELKDSILHIFPKVARLSMQKIDGEKIAIDIVKMPEPEEAPTAYSEVEYYAYVVESEPPTFASVQRQGLQKILKRFDLFQKSN